MKKGQERQPNKIQNEDRRDRGERERTKTKTQQDTNLREKKSSPQLIHARQAQLIIHSLTKTDSLVQSKMVKYHGEQPTTPHSTTMGRRDGRFRPRPCFWCLGFFLPRTNGSAGVAFLRNKAGCGSPEHVKGEMHFFTV